VPAQGDFALVAIPEPGARLARPTRITLQWVGRPGRPTQPPLTAGYAIASVFVAVEHARTARSVGRGESFGEADLVASGTEVGAVLLQRLPRLSDAAGARALRDLMADEVLTRSAVAARPMVQSGDVVAVRAAADGVTVQGQAVAQQSGEEGDVIRVVNRDSRRALKVRVVGPGRVEVVQ
jgi:flagella basal body P-ring formation protein FlgA